MATSSSSSGPEESFTEQIKKYYGDKERTSLHGFTVRLIKINKNGSARFIWYYPTEKGDEGGKQFTIAPYSAKYNEGKTKIDPDRALYIHLYDTISQLEAKPGEEAKAIAANYKTRLIMHTPEEYLEDKHMPIEKGEIKEKQKALQEIQGMLQTKSNPVKGVLATERGIKKLLQEERIRKAQKELKEAEEAYNEKHTPQNLIRYTHARTKLEELELEKKYSPINLIEKPVEQARKELIKREHIEEEHEEKEKVPEPPPPKKSPHKIKQEQEMAKLASVIIPEMEKKAEEREKSIEEEEKKEGEVVPELPPPEAVEKALKTIVTDPLGFTTKPRDKLDAKDMLEAVNNSIVMSSTASVNSVDELKEQLKKGDRAMKLEVLKEMPLKIKGSMIELGEKGKISEGEAAEISLELNEMENIKDLKDFEKFKEKLKEVARKIMVIRSRRVFKPKMQTSTRKLQRLQRIKV